MKHGPRLWYVVRGIFCSLRVSALLQTEGDIPLVVNLDGPLLTSNSLLESLFHLLANNAELAINLPRWVAGGRARLKHELASRTTIDAALLPYDETVVEYLRNKRANGRRLVLVSSSNQRVVDRVARHFGFFDEAHGSTHDLNLTGQARADFLIKRFGEGRFDYLGQGTADMPVWATARRVVIVDATAPLRQRIDSNFPGAEHVRAPRASLRQRLGAYVAALRINQWVKNLLVFVPMVADHTFDAPVALAAAVAFVTFCLTASSVYILNDLVDLPHDRKHQWKHTRPFAAGRVPILHGIVLIVALLAGAVLLAVSYLDLSFLLVLGTYYLLTVLYSLKLKRVLVIDLMALAGLYTIRVVAGSVATGIALSEWLLALSMFIFLALAAVKRQSELMNLAKRDRSRAPGRRYVVSDLPMIRNFGTSAGYISVLVLALYISNPEVGKLYKHPLVLWATCPLLLYWISRMLMKAHRGELHEDPIVFAFRDRASIYVAFAMGAVVFAAAAPWP